MKTPTARHIISIICLLFLAGAIRSQAQNGTWTNNIMDPGTNRLDTTWSNSTNWLNGVVADGSGSTAFFNAVDIPSNSTIVVSANVTNSVSLTNGNMFFGDTVTASSPGNWIIADAGFPLTLDSTASPNSVIDVNLAQGAANNLAAWSSATITANLAGTNNLVKTGPSHLILNPTSGNNYSGATIISNGMVQLGTANQAGTANATTLGGGLTPVYFRGGSLRLQNAAIPGSNPGNGGGGISAFPNPIVVEAGQTGTLYTPPRAFPAINGTVSGGGTLNMWVDYVRGNLAGEWSSFTGTLVVAASTRGNSQFKPDGNFNSAGILGLANARLMFTNNGVNANTVEWRNQAAAGSTFAAGEISATLPGIVTLYAAGGNNGNAFILVAGGLNTDSSFSGNFQPENIGLIKEGTGTLILNGTSIENTGMTVVSNGVLQIGSGTSGKLGRTAVVTNYATLAFGRSDTSLVVTNVIDGPGTVRQQGSGRTTLSPLTGASTYTGKTVVTAGTLAIGTLSALGVTPGSLVADQLTLNGGSFAANTNLSINDVNRGISLGAAGGGLGADGTNTLTVANVIGGAGNLTINNTGTVSPTVANNYTGKTILQSGTLLLSSESPLGTAPGVATADQITFNGGTLRSSATFLIDDANRGITVNGAGGTISPDASTTLTISEPIAGTGTLTKSGAGILVLNGTVSSTVTTTVGQGTLQIGAGGSIASQSISVPAGSTFNVTALAGGLVLASGQTLSGNGTVLGNVTAPTGSTLSAGTSVGMLTVSGNLTLSGGTNRVEISSSTNDVINVTGNLTLTGTSTIRLELLSNLPPGTNQLIKYSGTFSGDPSVNLVLSGYPVSRLAAQLQHNAVTKSIDLVLTGSTTSLVWTGGQGGNAWDVVSTINWLNLGTPDVFYNGDTVNFNNVGSTNPTANLTASVSPSSVVVSGTTDYTLAGNGKLTGAAGISKDGSSTLTVLTTNDASGAVTITAGTIQVGNGIASGSLGTSPITDNASLVFNFPSTQTVANAIGGTGSLTLQAGTAVLTGDNSYGASSINGGATLQVGNGGASGSLGAGGVTDNGSLVFKRTGNVTNSGSISGGGSLTVAAAGTVALGANNSYSGPTTVNTGTLQVGVGGTAGTVGTAGSVTLTNGGTLAFNRSDDLTNVVNVIGTNGTLAQIGAGTLVITNDANNYGPTRVSNGKLQLGDGVNASGTLGRGTITVTAPGTLVINRPDAYTMTNNLVGNGSVAYIGPSNSITVPAGVNTYSGGTTISNSSIVLIPPVTAPTVNGFQNVNGGAFGTGPITFLGNSTVQLAAATQTDPDGAGTGNFGNAVTVPASQTLTLYTPGRFEFSSAVSGAGTINYGANYVRGNVTGPWTNFTGTLNVISNAANTNNVAHDFRIANALGFPNARVNLGPSTFTYNRSTANAVIPFGELTGDATSQIAAGGGTGDGAQLAFTARVGGLNTDATFDGTLVGTVNVIKEGTGKWTLTGVNSYTGNTTISNGTLALAIGTLGDGDISGSAIITVAAPGVLDVSGRSDGTLNLSTALGGNGSINGNLVVGGTVSPGFSIGTLTVTTNITFNGGVLNIEVNRAGLQSDRLVARNIVLNSPAIAITNLGSAFLEGDTFTILQASGGTISGTLGTVTGGFPAVGPQTGGWDTSQLLVNGTIIATNVPPSPVLTAAVNGGAGTLDFSWPAEYAGYRLFAQTNTLAVGLSTNWVAVEGTEAGSTYSAPINTTNGTVFFRLQYP